MEGSSAIYHRVIRPYFLKHESAIDDLVKKGTDKVTKFADNAVDKGSVIIGQTSQ